MLFSHGLKHWAPDWSGYGKRSSHNSSCNYARQLNLYWYDMIWQLQEVAGTSLHPPWAQMPEASRYASDHCEPQAPPALVTKFLGDVLVSRMVRFQTIYLNLSAAETQRLENGNSTVGGSQVCWNSIWPIYCRQTTMPQTVGANANSPPRNLSKRALTSLRSVNSALSPRDFSTQSASAFLAWRQWPWNELDEWKADQQYDVKLNYRNVYFTFKLM